MSGDELELSGRGKDVYSALVDIYYEGRKSTTKSKYVAKRTDYSAKEVAQVMARLEERGVVKAWGDSNPTTWMLFPNDHPEFYDIA